MSVIIDILRSLGAGESLVITAILVLVAWYLFKGVKLGKTIGAMLGSVTAYVVAGLLVIAVAVGLGWLDPRPSAFIDTVVGAGKGLWNAVGDSVVDWLTGVVP